MKRKTRLASIVIILAALLVVGVISGVMLGSVRIPSGDVWAIILKRLGFSIEPWWTAAREAIVWNSRLPRALSAAIVGAALALSGAAAQLVTRNPLADPYLLGVSSGAGFGVVCVSVLGLTAGVVGWFTIPLAAFLGGMIPLMLALVLGGAFKNPTAVILIGIAVGSVFSALTSFVLLVIADERQLSNVVHWMAGGFGATTWTSLLIPLISLLIVGNLLFLGGRQLDLLYAGDDGATALGMNVVRFRVWILLAVSLLAGTSVAVAGGIGFIGLLIPHLARLLVGGSARAMLPVSALAGAVALVGADTFARSISRTLELPIGVVTSLIGSPFFIWMLVRRNKSLSRPTQ